MSTCTRCSENGLEGDADLWGVDVVYKYDADAAYGKGDFKFQAEYLRSIKDTKIRSASIIDEETGEVLDTDSGLIGSTRKFTTDGLYAQAGLRLRAQVDRGPALRRARADQQGQRRRACRLRLVGPLDPGPDLESVGVLTPARPVRPQRHPGPPASGNASMPSTCSS